MRRTTSVRIWNLFRLNREIANTVGRYQTNRPRWGPSIDGIVRLNCSLTETVGGVRDWPRLVSFCEHCNEHVRYLTEWNFLLFRDWGIMVNGDPVIRLKCWLKNWGILCLNVDNCYEISTFVKTFIWLTSAKLFCREMKQHASGCCKPAFHPVISCYRAVDKQCY